MDYDNLPCALLRPIATLRALHRDGALDRVKINGAYAYHFAKLGKAAGCE